MHAVELEYQKGRRLIDENIRRRARLSSYDLFRSCWSIIEQNKDLFVGRATICGFHAAAWRVLVYHDFVKYFIRLRPDFSPLVRDLPAPEGAAIMLSVHTGLELGIVSALTAKGKPVAVISAKSGQNRERSIVFRPRGNVQYIAADSNSLINSRLALREGRVVVADCDYPLPENPTANAVRAISNSLFELAKRSRSELCFVLPHVDTRGHIDFVHRSIDIPPHDTADCRPCFVEFLKSCGMGWIRWELH